MVVLHKRLTSLILSLLLVVTLFGCRGLSDEFTAYKKGLSVNFIDVGTGDCIYINLPDGKNMLIDTGEDVGDNLNKIKSVLSAYSVNQIDYLVLSHPNSDHVNNAKEIIDSYKIDRAFIPKITTPQGYEEFKSIENALRKECALVEYSMPFLNLSGKDYKIYFLSPCGKEYIDEYYLEFNASKFPTMTQENDLSPIIFLEYLGVKFLFTGDAGVGQESRLMYYYYSGIYEVVFKEFSLRNVDVLKVAHHGSDSSTSTSFAELIRPSLAIFTVGADNAYSLPSSDVINRVKAFSPECEILRTDLDGTITVNVVEQDEYKVYKQ